ncbi:MAG: hypothetical protein KDB73_20800, partial [Planctomycetes bacterium]|nr:hypothetical protein [Planctomycetota bacterium]
MATWKAAAAWVALSIMLLVGGSGFIDPERAEATEGGDSLIVLVSPQASLGPVASLLQAASWTIELQNSAAGLLRVGKGGPLAWPVGTLRSSLQALGVVRAAEAIAMA